MANRGAAWEGAPLNASLKAASTILSFQKSQLLKAFRCNIWLAQNKVTSMVFPIYSALIASPKSTKINKSNKDAEHDLDQMKGHFHT